MTRPITYVELNSPDLPKTVRFMADVFGWDPQPFATDDYLVAPAGGTRGVDCGLLASRDGQPRVVPIINVERLDEALASVRRYSGTVVVEPFAISGVGRGCYCTDPAGLLFGMHEHDLNA
jgi:predicted enzyme related to lactoylglutathione lyase